MSEESREVTRRKFLGVGSAAALAAALPLAWRVHEEAPKLAAVAPDHHLPNEQNHGPQNPLEADNPSAVWATETDSGTVPPFKYPFALARKKRIESGGWTRQVTARELPISKTIAGVEMRLTAGGVRELHWHVSAEWAIMLYGNARITAVGCAGERALFRMWVKVTCGCFHRVCRTRSRDWGLTGRNFYWCSTTEISTSLKRFC